MKRLGLTLLAYLTLVLPTVAQAPQKAAPDDLVVTAEIVGYSKSVHKGKESYGLYAKMVVRNTSSYPRDINMMVCAWCDSWIAQRAQGAFEPVFITGCDANYPTAVTIPVGESVTFNCPLLWLNANVKNENESIKAVSFNLGFADLSYSDVGHFGSNDDIKELVKRARRMYWSNTLSNEIDLAAMKEVAQPYPTYHLTWDDK